LIIILERLYQIFISFQEYIKAAFCI
jgi:hypothetical protein